MTEMTLWARLHTGDPGYGGLLNRSKGNRTSEPVILQLTPPGLTLVALNSPVWMNEGKREWLEWLSLWDGPSNFSDWVVNVPLENSYWWSKDTTFTLTGFSIRLTP